MLNGPVQSVKQMSVPKGLRTHRGFASNAVGQVRMGMEDRAQDLSLVYSVFEMPFHYKDILPIEFSGCTSNNNNSWILEDLTQFAEGAFTSHAVVFEPGSQERRIASFLSSLLRNLLVSIFTTLILHYFTAGICNDPSVDVY